VGTSIVTYPRILRGQAASFRRSRYDKRLRTCLGLLFCFLFPSWPFVQCCSHRTGCCCSPLARFSSDQWRPVLWTILNVQERHWFQLQVAASLVRSLRRSLGRVMLGFRVTLEPLGRNRLRPG